MAAFKFRLQSFLNLKEKLEEQKKLDYGKAVQLLEIEKNKKRFLEEENKKTTSMLKQKMEALIKPMELHSFNQYIDFILKEIEKQTVIIKRAEKIAEEKRLTLVKAMQERKMMEKLKDKDLVAFMEETLRAEQKLVDEITSFQYARKDGAGV